MKIASKREKWAVGILVLVCAGLVINVVMQTVGVKAGAPHPRGRTAPAATPQDSKPAAAKAAPPLSARNDARLQLDLLEQLQARPLPPLDRNPFEFGLTPSEKAARIQQEKIKNQPPSPPGPPPPPPVTVKAFGFVEDKAGKRKAILADDQDSYQVVEGESFAGRYKCVQITPTAVEIQDESYHQTVQLPFPQ